MPGVRSGTSSPARPRGRGHSTDLPKAGGGRRVCGLRRSGEGERLGAPRPPLPRAPVCPGLSVGCRDPAGAGEGMSGSPSSRDDHGELESRLDWDRPF